jgi:hypothetical protein
MAGDASMLTGIQTLMWLLPIVFMVHEFEEIIMMRPWYLRNEAFLKARFPRISRSIARTGTLSTSAFSLATAEEFIVLSVVTLACVEYGLYSVWAGFLIGFFIHLIYHMGSFILMGRYVPYVVTSVIACIYSVYALIVLNDGGYLAWSGVAIWSVIGIVFIIANLMFAVAVAEKFDQWLGRWSSPRQE